MTERIQLGQLLLAKQLVDPGELREALAEQEQSGGRLGALLVRRGSIAEDDLVRALAGQLRTPVARIRGKTVNPEILALVPVQAAEKYRCLPLFTREEGGTRLLFLALEDPSDRDALDELSFQLGERLRPVLIGPADLEDALQRHYHGDAVLTSTGAMPPLAVPVPPPVVRAPEPDEDTETAPELPPADPLLHPGAVPCGGTEDTAPKLGETDPCATPAPAPPTETAVDPQLILRALSQLLVEKGVIEREELVGRLRALASREK